MLSKKLKKKKKNHAEKDIVNDSEYPERNLLLHII